MGEIWKKKKKVVTPVIRFKVEEGAAASATEASHTVVSTLVGSFHNLRRRLRRRTLRRRRVVRRRPYRSQRPPKPWQIKKSAYEIAEDFVEDNGLAFPCGCRKSGKNSLGKKPRAP